MQNLLGLTEGTCVSALKSFFRRHRLVLAVRIECGACMQAGLIRMESQTLHWLSGASRSGNHKRDAVAIELRWKIN